MLARSAPSFLFDLLTQDKLLLAAFDVSLVWQQTCKLMSLFVILKFVVSPTRVRCLWWRERCGVFPNLWCRDRERAFTPTLLWTVL